MDRLGGSSVPVPDNNQHNPAEGSESSSSPFTRTRNRAIKVRAGANSDIRGHSGLTAGSHLHGAGGHHPKVLSKGSEPIYSVVNKPKGKKSVGQVPVPSSRSNQEGVLGGRSSSPTPTRRDHTYVNVNELLAGSGNAAEEGVYGTVWGDDRPQVQSTKKHGEGEKSKAGGSSGKKAEIANQKVRRDDVTKHDQSPAKKQKHNAAAAGSNSKAGAGKAKASGGVFLYRGQYTADFDNPELQGSVPEASDIELFVDPYFDYDEGNVKFDKAVHEYADKYNPKVVFDDKAEGAGGPVPRSILKKSDANKKGNKGAAKVSVVDGAAAAAPKKKVRVDNGNKQVMLIPSRRI